jgi:hypothetical protein
VRFLSRLIVECVLPRGTRRTIMLWAGDSVNFASPGDADPVVTVERLGFGRIRVTIRSDDERLTAGDLDLLREHSPKST